MIEVVHYQRKRTGVGHHSIESIFKRVRDLQPSDINITLRYPRFVSNGIFKRLYNVFEAVFTQKDVNHVTGDIHFINLLQSKRKNILTIHDCGLLKRTSGVKHAIIKFFWFTLPAKKASIITVNSNFTKQDLLTYIKFPEDKVVPVYVMISDLYTPYPASFNKTKPVILQVGSAVNKNIVRVAQALKGIDCKYIILGKLTDEVLSALQQNSIHYENIPHSIPDEEIVELYKQCDIVAFASTFEGFGMPIIEGNTTGRVVVTSNISSMPEVASNAAEYVDPLNVEDIRRGFLKVINDDVYREQLIENGFANASRFNKQTIANQYFNLYRTIAKATA